MPLRVTRRTDRGNALTIDGTINGKRVQRRASTDNFDLAQEEAALLEARLLREIWHGPKKGSRTLSEAVISYIDADPRSPGTRQRLRRILEAFDNDPALGTIDQDTVIRLKGQLLRPGAKPATVLREITGPLRAVLTHAAARRWCDPPIFAMTKMVEGRTRCMSPAEAQRLIDAAAPHLQPLLIFLFCTGCRLSETLQLDWEDVRGNVAIIWGDSTKSGRRRNVDLVLRAVATLQGIPGNSGKGHVFLKPDGKPYPVTRSRGYGGQVKTGWDGAIRRAGLDPDLTPHDARHTWASWCYCLDPDPLKLMYMGGWSSLKLVERYAHLVGSEHREAIEMFFRGS
jgi:site-specific recombinase XerD